MKKTLTILFLFLITTTFCIAQKRADFTGMWKLNLEKSEFNGAPTLTASTKYRIVQRTDSVMIERSNLSAGNTEATSQGTISLNGSSTTQLMPDKTTKVSTITWSDAGQTMITNSSYSAPDNPTGLLRKLTDSWTMSTDGKSFTDTRTVETQQMTYTIKAVYDKQ